MDPLYEEELMAEEEDRSIFYPVVFVFQFLSQYGWYVLGAALSAAYVFKKIGPSIVDWRDAQKDVSALREGERRARERQQRALAAAYAARAAAAAEERAKQAEQANASTSADSGSSSPRRARPLRDDSGYLPLSGGEGARYRAPKRSACGSCR